MYVPTVHHRPGNALLSNPNQVATSEYGTPASCTTIIAKLIAISVCTAGVSLGVSDSNWVGCDISAAKYEGRGLYSINTTWYSRFRSPMTTSAHSGWRG